MIILIITTVKRENQMMHNTIANCPQTNARPLFPNPYQLLFKVVSSSLYSVYILQFIICGLKYPFG